MVRPANYQVSDLWQTEEPICFLWYIWHWYLPLVQQQANKCLCIPLKKKKEKEKKIKQRKERLIIQFHEPLCGRQVGWHWMMSRVETLCCICLKKKKRKKFQSILLSLRTTKCTVRGKFFSRETAVSCSMCKKLCPLACKANTQHSQQHVCAHVCIEVCVLQISFFFVCFHTHVNV